MAESDTQEAQAKPTMTRKIIGWVAVAGSVVYIASQFLPGGGHGYTSRDDPNPDVKRIDMATYCVSFLSELYQFLDANYSRYGVPFPPSSEFYPVFAKAWSNADDDVRAIAGIALKIAERNGWTNASVVGGKPFGERGASFVFGAKKEWADLKNQQKWVEVGKRIDACNDLRAGKL